MNVIKGSVTLENYQNICKVCLEEKPMKTELSSILQLTIENVNILYTSIFDVLKLVSSHFENSENVHPTTICSDCLEELKISYIFQVKCEQSSQLLQAFYSNKETFSVKEEVIVFSDNDYEAPQSRKIRVRKKIVKRENRKTAHICPVCKKEFTALELREHIQTHKSLQSYLSIPNDAKVNPSTKFSTVRHIRNDTETIFKPSEVIHKCPYCNLQLTVQDFRAHVDTHRQKSNFKCEKCYRVFRLRSHLNIHKLKHLKEYPYICQHCNKGFVIKKNYDCHILTHEDVELPHECVFCHKRFSNPEHLNRHLLIHTENVSYCVKYKVCKCIYCLNSFKNKDALKSHACTPLPQIKNTRWPCKLCSKVFKYSSGLYNHNKNVHERKSMKKLCSVCGKYAINIHNHMIAHSGEKPYQCTQCVKRFATARQLKQHLLVHSGLKPFVCSVCGKAFNNLYNLQVHERIHLGIRNHICPICNKAFLEKSYLKKHLLVHKNLDEKVM